jgi:putative transposase
MKKSITAGAMVVALGKIAVVVEIKNSDEISVRISATGQLQTITVDDIEIIPNDPKTITELPNYDPADPREALQLIAASERTVILMEYLNGNMTVVDAAKKLSLKKSAFYALIKKFSRDLGVISVIKQKPGPRTGSFRTPTAVVQVVNDCFDLYYVGAAASYSHVWRQVQSECDAKGLPTPGLSTVQRLIKAMDAKKVHRQKHGADATRQRFEPRPGWVHTDHPLHHAQMDHTRVDIILRAEHDRNVVIGRPWVTLLIDVHTRVILGFYLSMYAPSLIAVQQTVCMAALPKDKSQPNSPCFGLNYPYYGMPDYIWMDNAKEFHSPIYEAALRKHGGRPRWRRIGKKHMGGTIERLIGTFMTTAVHFLPGTTYSNVEQRGDYDSEKKSALTFKEFCTWFAGQVLIYHGTVHSELKQSPKDAWEQYYSAKTGVMPPVIVNRRNFYIDFLPETHKPVRNNGITLNAGIYYTKELSSLQGKARITVKFDPYDMTSIWAKTQDDYISVPLVRSTHDCVNYEYYRTVRAYNKKTPPGTITDPEALLQIQKNNELVKKAKTDTKNSKRGKSQSEAQSQHHTRFTNGVPNDVSIDDQSTGSSSPIAALDVNFSLPPKLFDTKD